MPTEVGTVFTLDPGPALGALDRLEAGDRELRGELLQTQRAAQQAFGQSADRLGDIVAATNRAAAAQQQYSRDVAGLVKEIRDQGAAEAELRRAQAVAAAERRKANAEAREAARAEKAAAKEAANAAKEAAAAERLRAKEAAAANAQTGKGGGILGKLGSALGSLQGQVVAAFSIAAIKGFFSEVSEQSVAIQATISKLTFANGGNAQAAARDLAFIRNEADRLGLELNGAGQSYGSFVAAAAAGNFPLEQARKLFLATAGASATLRLSADDTQGVLLALTQILSKGTVAAEELRGQIGERLPGAFSIAARAMGVTEQQLNKLLSTGQIKSADFLPKFAEELQKTFGDGTAQAFDAAIANQNRFLNEYNAFLLRFQGITAAATAKAASYFKRFNEGLDLQTPEGRTALSQKAAQTDINNYGLFLEKTQKDYEAYAKSYKLTSKQLSQDISDFIDGQRKQLLAQQKEAQSEVAKFRLENPDGTPNAAGVKFYRQYTNGALGDPGGKRYLEDELAARRRAALIDGELAKLDELAAARKKADSPAELEGLIKRQEDIIKALKIRQRLPGTLEKNNGSGADFLLGPGGLDEQLKAAEKELDRLLGRVDKVAKAAADRLAAALRALAAARQELANKAANAATKEADDAALRAQLRFEQALKVIEQEEKKVQEAENRVRRAGGKGADADGVLAKQGQGFLSKLRIAALDAYYDELRKITEAQEQRLFELRADSDQKEIDAVNRKYDKLLATNTKGQSAEYDALDEAAGLVVDRLRKRSAEEIAIEEARERDLREIEFRRRSRLADREAGTATALVEKAGATYGVGTGVSVIAAKRAEKLALLDIEQKHAQAVLNNSSLLGTEEGKLARAQADANIARIKENRKSIKAEIAKSKPEDTFYGLIFGKERDSNEARAKFEQDIRQTIGAIQEILSVQLQAEQAKAQAHQDNINNLNAQLAAEIQLNREGAASNIKTVQEQLKAEKAAKREALQEARAIAKQQQLINDLQAVSSITVAVANVIAGWSTVPIVGSIAGIVAAAAMVAAFVATKSSAADAAKTSSFFVGGYTGDGNPRDTSTAVGPRPYEYHRREYVMPHDVTDKFRHSLLEPLHKGKPLDWTTPDMQALLPDLTLPDTMRAEKAAHVRHSLEISHAPLQAKFDALQAELADIKVSNREMADKVDRIPLADGTLLEVGKNGSTKRTTFV